MSDIKALTGVEIKDAGKGTVEAVFATLDVVDSDGDITVKGAFQDGAAVRISAYGHESWKGALPVGRGVIREGGVEAVLHGQFFMKTDHGRNTFETVRELDDLSEWSYGYDVLEKSDPGDEQKELGATRILEKLAVHEVSPVLLGAGVNTRTLAIKEQGLVVDYTPFTASSNNTLVTLDGTAIGRSVTAWQQKSFPDQFDGVLGDVTKLIDRVEGWGQDPEQKAGRVLSAANRDRLSELSASLGETLNRLEQLLADSDPEKDRGEIERQLLRYEQLRATL